MTFERVKSTLKSEFIGLDKIIDQFVDFVYTYTQVKNKLTRPMVLNIWGMTGYGKTSMIKRCFELLKINTNYINLTDANDNSPSIAGKYGTSKNIILGNLNNTQNDGVFIFDEFHNCREYDEFGSLLENKTYTKGIWELLDNGIISFKEDVKAQISYIQEYLDIIICYKNILEQNLLSIEGYKINIDSVSDSNFIKDLNNSSCDFEFDTFPPSKEGIIKSLYLRYRDIEDILIFYNIVYYNNSNLTLKRVLYKMFNGVKTIDEYILVLENLMAFLDRGLEIDFSKSLVINIGNLNGLYEMSGDMTLDITGDDYVDIVEELNLGDVKNELMKSFKVEQIGRLGNNHIIYPAFSDNTFKAIIRDKVDKLFKRYNSKNIKVVCNDSVIDFIFVKYCFANLGVRPLLTSIDSLYVDILCELNKNKIKGDITIDVSEDYKLIINGVITDKVLYFEKEIDKNQLVITSVHESGHFLLYYITTGKLPSKVISVGNSRSYNGFMLKKYKDIKTYMNKDMIYGELAVLLAGRQAETFVFGVKNITSGAVEDISRATRLATSYFRKYGMGGEGINVTPKSSNPNITMESNVVIEDDNDIRHNVEEMFSEISSYIISIFRNDSVCEALIKSSEMLIDKKKLNKDDMFEIVKNINLDSLKRYNGYEQDYQKIFSEFTSSAF